MLPGGKALFHVARWEGIGYVLFAFWEGIRYVLVILADHYFILPGGKALVMF